jgi:hypothetical protein
VAQVVQRQRIRKARQVASRLEAASRHVPMTERCPGERREDRMLVSRVAAPEPRRDQLVAQRRRKGQPPYACGRLRRRVLVVRRPLAPHVEVAAVLVEVFPPQAERLAFPEAERRDYAEQRRVVVLCVALRRQPRRRREQRLEVGVRPLVRLLPLAALRTLLVHEDAERVRRDQPPGALVAETIPHPAGGRRGRCQR